MLDGNRRWAKAVGADTAQGHRAGAANIEPLLGWCEEIGVVFRWRQRDPRPVYITEYGYQTNPPDRYVGVSGLGRPCG